MSTATDRPTRAPRIIEIPAGSRPIKCTCGRFFYYVRNTKGNYEPIRVQVSKEGHSLPSATQAGAGESHFIDCPNASYFRGKRKRA